MSEPDPIPKDPIFEQAVNDPDLVRILDGYIPSIWGKPNRIAIRVQLRRCPYCYRERGKHAKDCRRLE